MLLRKRNVISSIEPSTSGVMVMPSARTTPVMKSRVWS